MCVFFLLKARAKLKNLIFIFLFVEAIRCKRSGSICKAMRRLYFSLSLSLSLTLFRRWKNNFYKTLAIFIKLASHVLYKTFLSVLLNFKAVQNFSKNFIWKIMEFFFFCTFLIKIRDIKFYFYTWLYVYIPFVNFQKFEMNVSTGMYCSSSKIFVSFYHSYRFHSILQNILYF